MNTGSAPNRAIAFFDGQNLFAAARDAFGFTTPSYGDLVSLKPLHCSAAGI